MAHTNAGLPILYAQDQGRLKRIAGLLKSSKLMRLNYVVSGEGPFPGERLQRKVHEIDQGVELLTSSGGVVICWAMSGLVESLSVDISEATDIFKKDFVRLVDVSHLPEWQAFVAKPMLLRGMATHVPDGTDRATIWSLCFEASDDAKVVIALGEWLETGPEYLPDSLVAIFDETVARSYVIPDNPVSAWGVDWNDESSD